jgi:signal peptidase
MVSVRSASPALRTATAALQRVAALALLLLLGTLLVGTAPTLFGYETVVAPDGSMEPAIKAGDLAIVGPAKPDRLMVGDVITYRTAQRPDLLVTHRLVGMSLDDQGALTFQTKGDANDLSDQVKVNSDAVVGRVVTALPKLGLLIEFTNRPEGKALLIVLPGVLLALDALRLARQRRPAPALAASGDAVLPIRGEAGECLARGRVALQNGAPGAALAQFNQAIAANPFLEDAWMLKAQCLNPVDEALACLRAGLTVNPTSTKLRDALKQSLALHATAE